MGKNSDQSIHEAIYIWDITTVFQGTFFEKMAFWLLAPVKQMSVLTNSDENIFSELSALN